MLYLTKEAKFKLYRIRTIRFNCEQSESIFIMIRKFLNAYKSYKLSILRMVYADYFFYKTVVLKKLTKFTFVEGKT